VEKLIRDDEKALLFQC